MSEWYESFFDALAMDVWRAILPVEVSEAEADFLVRQLGGTPPGRRLRFLDVPCGDGRLALRVAARGHEVVGVDGSGYAIERLQADDPDGSVDARLGDMRDLGAALTGDAAFDGAWCMGNSFGYLAPDDTAMFLRSLAGRLRSGAGFVLDAATAAESLLPNVREGERDRHEGGGAVLGGVDTYDVRTSTMVTEMTLEMDGRRDVRTVRHRVMTCREIVEFLETAGFAVEAVLGGIDGEAFRVGSGRCLVTARRR